MQGEIALRIASVVRDHPVRVAIDGVDAAGKTTLADELVGPLRRLGRSVVRASVDGFHHPAEVRRRRGALSPEGYYRDSFDYSGLARVLLEPLGPGGSRRYRRAIYDSASEARVEAPFELAAPDAVLIFDGVFLLRRELRHFWDYSIFVRASFRVTVARARARDLALMGGADEVERRYARRYVPGQKLYLSDVDPERRVSLVLDNDDPERPEIVRTPSRKFAFEVRPVLPEDAAAFEHYVYPPPFDLYDSQRGSASGYLDPESRYVSVVDGDGELWGFGCIGAEAQVPGGRYEVGADGDGAPRSVIVDVGVGMSPARVGQGGGRAFCGAMAAFAASTGATHLRVTVAAFNTRSLRVWAALGFVLEHRFDHAHSGRAFVQLVAPCRGGGTAAAQADTVR